MKTMRPARLRSSCRTTHDVKTKVGSELRRCDYGAAKGLLLRHSFYHSENKKMKNVFATTMIGDFYSFQMRYRLGFVSRGLMRSSQVSLI